MKVLMKKTAKGPNLDAPAGKIIDLPEDIAAVFIESRIASAVETADTAPVETPEASTPEPEKAAKKTTKKKA